MSRFDRIQKSAKHYLGSVMFVESAKDAYELADTSLLAVVGLYYAGFHASVSMLWLCDERTEDDLTHLRHNMLHRYVNESLIQTKEIPCTYLEKLQKLQSIREYANYSIGSKAPDFEYRRDIHEWITISDELILCSTEYVHRKLSIPYQQNDSLLDFQTAIGDGFGADLIDLHVGKRLKERIIDRIIQAELTT